MTNDTNELYAVQVTASLPDNTGMLRVRTLGLSDLYAWPPEALEDCRRTEAEHAARAEILGPLTREEYDALTTGYRETLDSPVAYGPWVALA
jgi:hypothetical protein